MMPKIEKQLKNKKASNMGCKGPLDARLAAFESSRRALSDYAIQNAKKRNFSKVGCSVCLPPTKIKDVCVSRK